MVCRRSLMVSLLVSVLVALTPLAYASPPDPTYISGLWDDGDYDDVVILAAWASFVVDIHAGYDLAFVRVVLAVLPAADALISSLPLCLRAARAPPTA